MGPKTYFDSDLRERAENPSEVLEHISVLQKHLSASSDSLEKAKIHGEIGHWFKVLGQWEQAIECFHRALESAPRDALLATLEIRLADTLRLKGDFAEALRKFNQFSKDKLEWSKLEDFYHQHLGKLYFDQKQYKEALKCFQSAWVLRDKKQNAELLKSTELAIAETLKRLHGFS